MRKNIFYLRPNTSFDEDGATMIIQYYPVQIYNKSKSDKFLCFCILVDSKHYFVYHLHAYHTKNMANINISHLAKNSPTINKVTTNAKLNSGIKMVLMGAIIHCQIIDMLPPIISNDGNCVESRCDK